MHGIDVRIMGGGPGGLFLARMLRLTDPSGRVIVYERNPSDATFGFGVVFSDRTLQGFEQADPKTRARLIGESPRWTDMELRFRGTTLRYGGFGFTAIERQTLLRILREQAMDAGAEVLFGHPVELAGLAGSGADVVVAADGVHSLARAALAEHVRPSVEIGAAKYIWFGTEQRFDRVTFPFVTGEHGTFAAHAYPYADGLCSFIVEVDEDTWRRAGMEEPASNCQEPGRSDEYSRRYLEDLFSEHLGGRPLLVNNSKWANFRTVRNRSWHHGDTVLVGDAAHTAHFSVGSGTKIAMEDAIALAHALAGEDTPAAAFTSYERSRRPAVDRTQSWARPSQRWWETFSARMHLEPEQFGYHFLTRTKAISYRGLRRRDPGRIAAVESWFAARHPLAGDNGAARHALARPVTIGPLPLPGRLLTDIEPTPDGVRTLDLLAALRGGASLALADLRHTRACAPLPGAAAAAAAADPVSMWRRCLEMAGPAAVGARINAGDPASEELAAGAGFRAVQVDFGGGLPEAETLARLRELLGDQVMLMVGAPPPSGGAWSPNAAAMLRRCAELAEAGADLLRIIGPMPASAGNGLAHLELLDRVRTETGLGTCADAAVGWGAPAPADRACDPAEQAHIALVSGRIDLVAGWPLPAPAWGFCHPAGPPADRG